MLNPIAFLRRAMTYWKRSIRTLQKNFWFVCYEIAI